MEQSRTPKNASPNAIRELILYNIPQAQETDRAEADLNALSFRSKLFENRHIWISVFCEELNPIMVDLEDWNDEQEWDNSVAHVELHSHESVVAVCKAWLTGANISECLKLKEEARKK